MINTPSIYRPDLRRIVDKVDDVKEAMKHEFIKIRERFSSKKLYPEIGKIVERRDDIMHILSDEFNRHHGWFVFNQFGDINQADELINLSSFYDIDDLQHIRTSDDLKRVIEFTEWLGEQYDALLKIGGPLSTAVTENISLEYGGLSINPYRGILVLRYRDEYGYKKTQLYCYHHYHYHRDDGILMRKVDLNPNVTISLGLSWYARAYRPPYKNGLNSLICMSTSVPAALDETTKIIARHLLLRKLVYLTDKKGKIPRKH